MASPVLGSIPSEMCSNQVVRAYLEMNDLEYREKYGIGEKEKSETYFRRHEREGDLGQ